MPKFVIGGNWKMQVPRVEDSVSRARAIATAIEDIPESVEVFVAPSPVALHAVGEAVKGTKLKLAGQNMHYLEKGAFTGETSVDSLLDAGCEYVILGHSERRRIFGESDDVINKKVKLALERGLKVVLCIGETARERAEGRVKDINREQLQGSLAGVTPEQVGSLVVAYEPVWAINNPYLNPDSEIKTATPEEAREVHRFVRMWLIGQFGIDRGSTVPIQYGGSMKPGNAEGLLQIENVDGGLVGGASLSAETFKPIVEAAAKLSS
ncbi:MAG: triose-phosphate isomerase [Promethearchaeota archaeon]